MYCGFEIDGKALILSSQQNVLASLLHSGHKYAAQARTEL